MRQLVGALVAGQGDLGGVHHDDEVTGVDVRGELGLVLAAQQGRRGNGQTPEDDIVGIDHMPGPGDLTRLGAVRRHARGPLPLVGVRLVRDLPSGRPQRNSDIDYRPVRPWVKTTAMRSGAGRAGVLSRPG